MPATILLMLFLISVGASCQESLEERAARDAREFTRKHCPTPTINYSRTDSLTFDADKRLYTYYCTLSGPMDNAEAIAANKQRIATALAAAICDMPSMKQYVSAGFKFRYILHSESNPKTILMQTEF